MNHTTKYKLVPMIALSKDEATLDSMHDQLLKLLKNREIDSNTKRVLYEDLLKRVANFKMDIDYRQPPAVVTTASVEDENAPGNRQLAVPKQTRKSKKGVQKRRLGQNEDDAQSAPLQPAPIAPLQPPLPYDDQDDSLIQIDEPTSLFHRASKRALRPVPALPRTTVVSVPRGKKRALTDYLSDKRKRNFATAMLSAQSRAPKTRNLDEEEPLSSRTKVSRRPQVTIQFDPPLRRKKQLAPLPKLPREIVIQLPRGKKRGHIDVLPTTRKRDYGTAVLSSQSRAPKIHTSHFNQSGDGRLSISSWH